MPDPRPERTPDDEGASPDPPVDRESPVGEPVVRGDAAVTGERANDAVAFDPEDPDSLASAATTVAAFAEGTSVADDNVFMLRGAAACAALVRGEGSYKAAAERAGEGVTVSFVRKWARVHDLPRSIRRHVAVGEVAPSAAKHVARVSGTARLHLAWALLDADLTVRDVRELASAIDDGVAVETALRETGVAPGEITVSLPLSTYCELRRQASLAGVDPGDLVADALERELE